MKLTTDPNSLKLGDLIIYQSSVSNYKIMIIGVIDNIKSYSQGFEKYFVAKLDILYDEGDKLETDFSFSTGSASYENNKIFRAKDDPYKAMRIVFNYL